MNENGKNAYDIVKKWSVQDVCQYSGCEFLVRNAEIIGSIQCVVNPEKDENGDEIITDYPLDDFYKLKFDVIDVSHTTAKIDDESAMK